MDEPIRDISRSPTKLTVETDILGVIGERLRTCCGAMSASSVVVVTDHQVGELYAERVLDSLRGAGFVVGEFRIDAGEASKSLEVAASIYQYLAVRELDRDGVIVALGGGVVSDLAGFVAATWMRGVRFAICPTTVEACVDAAIGGKTAVNIPAAKNLVGAFHQPILVAIDPSCLLTLSPRDVRSGLAESVKHGVVLDPSFLDWHEQHVESIVRLDSATLTELIRWNIRLKSGIVLEDAEERLDRRILLNFGHTIGHAIETCSGSTLRHGECVSLGMVAVCRLSCSLGLLAVADAQRVESILSRFELPTRLADSIESDRIMAAIRKDKKVRGGVPRLVLLERIGRPVVRGDVPEEAIREAYESLLP